MKNGLKIVLLLFFGTISAQEKVVQTTYFELNKHNLYNQQTQDVVNFIKKIDTTKIESIQIFGYCDDRGSDFYNCKLSKNRGETVQKILVEYGINKNKIAIVEGKGRIIPLEQDIEKIFETRSKNRRVDLIVVNKTKSKTYLGIKGLYNSFDENIKIKDRIFLEQIVFPIGSSVLSLESKKELDKFAVLLQKYPKLEFEIRGNVCCTPNYYPDAIDRKTHERKLSVNRARTVYRYLLSKNINSSRMTYEGYGNQFPLKQGDLLDRRVEFLITKK